MKWLINVPALVARLQGRWQMAADTLPEEQLSVSNDAVFSIPIDELLLWPLTDDQTKDLSVAAGTKVAYHTVPSGYRDRITSYWKSSTTANSRVFVTIGGVTHYLTAPSGADMAENNLNLLLGGGDVFGRTATGIGGDNARQMTIHYERTRYA